MDGGVRTYTQVRTLHVLLAPVALTSQGLASIKQQSLSSSPCQAMGRLRSLARSGNRAGDSHIRLPLPLRRNRLLGALNTLDTSLGPSLVLYKLFQIVLE